MSMNLSLGHNITIVFLVLFVFDVVTANVKINNISPDKIIYDLFIFIRYNILYLA